MHSSKLVALLGTFKTRDYRRFREFLHSPFFNKRQDLVRFYLALEQFAPDFFPTNFDQQQLWDQYAPNQPYNHKELTYLANFLLKQAEHFLAIEAYENDPTSQSTHFLAYCREHNLPKHYRATLLRARKELQAESFRDSDWHLKAWRLADVEMQYFYASRSRKADGSIKRVMNHLDAFYLDRKLEIGAELLNLNQMFQEQYDTAFVDELLKLLDHRPQIETTVNLRRLILKIQLEPEDTDSFSALLALLPVTHEYYPPERVKGIFAYAQNHCIRRIQAGDQSYQAQLFQTYQQSIRSGLIYENGELSPWDFKNIVSIALKMGEFAWTEQFIQENKTRIAGDFRPSALAYNTGNLYFHQGQFDKAVRALQAVAFSDVFYALDTRRILLRIYFERGETESLLALISSFRAYLTRTTAISARHQMAYKNFIDWAARLYRLSEKELAAQHPQLASELRKTESVVDREWLENILNRS